MEHQRVSLEVALVSKEVFKHLAVLVDLIRLHQNLVKAVLD